PDYGKPGTRIKLQGVRRAIAEHMVRAKQTIPHYTYVDECDVTDLVRLRQALRPRFEEAGVKLTYLAFVVKAVAGALREVPIVNRPVFDDAGVVRPAEMVYLSFSFDHRVVDGAVGAAFGNAVLRRLQNPAALLLPDKLG